MHDRKNGGLFVKWIGALMVVLASFFVGSLLASEEKKRLTCVDSLLSLFKYMKRRMSAERKPLFAIFCEFKDDYLESIDFLESMRSNRNSKTAWQSAIEKLYIDEETERELTLLGNELGELTLYEELMRLENCISFLEEKKKILQKTLPPKQKSVKTVCLLSGVLLAIIML